MNKSNSYKTILKSTSLVGGAQVIKVVFNLIRSKVLAMIIGPAGIGLIGAFQSVLQLVQSIAGLGVGFSAVRDIAKANESNDQKIISETILTLRRIVIVLGVFGTLMGIILSESLSKFTFGTYEYSLEIKILSIIIFLNIVSGGQNALIQGLRRIKDLAKLNVLGAFYGTLFSIPLIFFFKEKGIVPFLIMVAIAQLITSWWYARKVKIKKIKLELSEIMIKSREMVKLGIAFMSAGFVTIATNYLIRVLIIRNINLDAAGFYQAAIVISSLYIGIILEAMGKDFYPRLAAVSDDSVKSIQIINEQSEIGMLLAAPGLLFTLALAPYLINLFYSSEFKISYQILRWMILGVFLRTISWPLGYLFVAKGEGNIFFLTEVVFNLLHLGFILFFVHFYTIVGTGIAFFLLYVIYTIILKILASFEIGFYWSMELKKQMMFLCFVFTISFLILLFNKQIAGSIIVSLIAIVVSLYSLRKIMGILGIDTYGEVFQLVKMKLGKYENK